MRWRWTVKILESIGIVFVMVASGSAQWTVSGTNIFYNSGNVGIGTSSPSHRFHAVTSTGTRAIYGLHTAQSGYAVGIFGEVYSTSGFGVVGYAPAGIGNAVGVYGQVDSNVSARGLLGLATATTGYSIGVQGEARSPNGRGVFGLNTATTGIAVGVYGQSASVGGAALVGWATARNGATFGLYAQSDSPAGRAVYGISTATTGLTYGVLGQANSLDGYALYALGDSGASGFKTFRIDHPLDPANRYLIHYSAEGPEPLNLYTGIVVTDQRGYAVVQLPDYFSEINRDPRYQLTVIDDSDDFVLAKVVSEIEGNQFVIRTSKPFVKVSWEVKAVRNDLWARWKGAPVEVEKPAHERGRYQHPALYAQPKEQGIGIENLPNQTTLRP